ncbi:MAG: hypothetical protein Q7S57_00655 [bacterium]|nr:hypothetical protein [bacterium]
MNVSVLLYEAIKFIIPLLPILIPLSAVVFLFVPSRKLLALFLFFLGFQALFIDVGVMVNIPRVLLFFSLLTLVLYFPKDLATAMDEYPGRIMIIILIIFFSVSALLNIPSFPVKSIVTAYGPIGDSLFRDRATKQMSQIMMFALKASIPLVILAICRSRKQIVSMVKISLIGTSMLCIYGIYQYFAYLYNLPSIFIFRGASNPTGGIGIFSTSLGNFFRISSLAGEPKDLAGILLPFSVLLGVITWRVIREKKYRLGFKSLLLGIFLLHVFIFTMTFSTAGWLSAVVAVIGILGFSVNWKPKFKPIILVFGAFLGLFAVYILVPSVNEVVKQRFISRLNLEYITNDVNYGGPQLLHMYKTHPETIIYGASLGGAVFYEQYNEQPESFVYYLFDYGLLGILFLCYFFYLIVKKVLYLSKQNNLENDILFNGLLYAMIGSMASTLVFPKIDAMLGLWVLIGLTSALVVYSRGDGKGLVRK